MNTQPTPISDRIVSQFRKGEAHSDGLILTMVELELKLSAICRERNEALEQLTIAITEIAATPARWILAEYAGCYNVRPMRDGSRLSKHAWGIAIDFAPATNGLRTHWPRAANMPIEAMEAFARVGFLSAGAFWSRDAMHFEATR